MNFKLSQNLFSQLVQTAARFINPKPSLPVLANILLEAEKNKLKITATNLETAIILQTQSLTQADGKITIPARILAEFVSQLPQKEVSVKLVDKNLVIVSGNFEAKLTTIDASEFPAIPILSEKPTVKIDSDRLSRALSKVIFAAASDEVRPTLTGVLWEVDQGYLRLVATDGYRLAVEKILQPVKLTAKKLIVPAKALNELVKLEGDSCQIYLAENQIGFCLDDATLISRLIEGTFPDWGKIVPSEFKTTATVDRDEFLRGVRICSILARDGGNVIRANLDKNSINLTAKAAELGENKAQIKAVISGEPSEIAFNFHYLLDALEAIGAEQVWFGMNGPLAPGLFKAANDKTSDSFQIIMPVRV